MGAYFLPESCKMMLRPEIFPTGFRDCVQIRKSLPDAEAIFPSPTLWGGGRGVETK